MASEWRVWVVERLVGRLWIPERMFIKKKYATEAKRRMIRSWGPTYKTLLRLRKYVREGD